MNENPSKENETNQAKGMMKGALFAAIVILLLMIAGTAWAHFRLPDGVKIPIHWNGKGEVDGWSGKSGLWMTPGVAVFLLVLFTVIPFMEPRLGRKLLASKAYCLIILALLMVMLSVHIGIIVSSFGKQFPMTPVICSAIGILFMIIGNYCGKIRSNLIMGIRTYWTLNSELSWKKTHRLSGKMFFLYGLAIFIVGWIPGADGWIFGVTMAGLILLVVIAIIYSWFVWKNDPAKTRKGES